MRISLELHVERVPKSILPAFCFWFYRQGQLVFHLSRWWKFNRCYVGDKIVWGAVIRKP